ncbi:DUF6192 family protein [Streptomyces sp. UG1]|uniref:DUF6192 family protein n=1 Tax=Streptomyces sp. UG1 TaxID=3417652 RepID=UPI003CE9DB56
MKRIEHATELLDLVLGLPQLVANAGRIVPRLRERHLTDDERTVIHTNVARVRAPPWTGSKPRWTPAVDVDAALGGSRGHQCHPRPAPPPYQSRRRQETSRSHR